MVQGLGAASFVSTSCLRDITYDQSEDDDLIYWKIIIFYLQKHSSCQCSQYVIIPSGREFLGLVTVLKDKSPLEICCITLHIQIDILMRRQNWQNESF